MPLGVNLSFCVKRWATPALWARLVREEIGLSLVQLTFDLVDPAWPDALLDGVAREIRVEAARHGLTLHSAFVGLAHYSFNQLLHPDPRVRDVAEAWLARAYRFAGQAGIPRVGGPLGAIASRPDGQEADAIPQADYRDLIARMHRLAEAGAAAGLTELYVEPTPLRREWPWTVAQAARMAGDVAGAALPWRYCLDWGHGTCEPLYGAGAGMEPWFSGLGDRVGMVHIQQTDFRLDRHWDFTRPGRVDPGAAIALQRRHGLAAAPVFLEVFYPFEQDDASVLDGVRRSAALLREACA
ncbi:D-erythrulose 1-phosphate 3-epimerase [Methylobacterium crusticola]|uniref:D-erythrulose 1-phosphate 3-epimerase n=1 Tax=Methylobacterium crusticola TaxID=1697972 RepID=A0ABQ4QXL2_9HYPH|nr:D-erythrulose 1-phosphate 3-epimerase [Methylobacterium crusticola]